MDKISARSAIISAVRTKIGLVVNRVVHRSSTAKRKVYWSVLPPVNLDVYTKISSVVYEEINRKIK